MKVSWWIAAVAVVLLLFFYRYAGQRPSGEEVSGKAATPSFSAEAPHRLLARGPSTPPPSVAVDEESDGGAALPTSPEMNAGDYPVNLVQLREKLPDNLYFRVGEPTEDPQILQSRAEEEQRWNELYGKVQSNTASEEEIHRYYDYRTKLSEDYIEFASLVLDEYKDKLPERDRGLYELSIRMHRTRLSEIPRQTEDALLRKQAYDKRKEEWAKSEKGD